MPATIPVHIAIRSQLKDSVENTLRLDTRLELLIAHKPWRPSGNFHGKVDFSQPPWHAPVAHCHLDLHSMSRKLEREFRIERGFPIRERGGSAANTRKALEALHGLSEGIEDFMVKLVTRELEKWSRRASIVLEDTEAPKRLPRRPDHPEPACPFCKCHTLRSRSLEGKIYCINPKCKDEEGRKPEARMIYSPVVGDWTILWQDNVVGLP